MYACRACRIPLSAEHGCAICESIRKHLVALDEDDGESPSLSTVSGEVVAGLRAALKTVRDTLRDAPGDDKAAGKLIAIANSVAKVVESGRKLQADGLAVLQNMSALERLEIFIGWYAELPPAYRTRLREQLEKFELEASAPVKELPGAAE